MKTNYFEMRGIVGNPPDVRFTPNGKPVAPFSLYTRERWTDSGGEQHEKSQRHQITVWGAQAEFAEKRLVKGSRVQLGMRRSALAKQFGAVIRRLSLELGDSQEEFAHRCGLHCTYIGAIERGEKTVTIETADRLANALGLTLVQLFVHLEQSQKRRVDKLRLVFWPAEPHKMLPEDSTM